MNSEERKIVNGIGMTPIQSKVVAAGLSVLSASVVLAFICFIGYMTVKFLSYVSAAITPVVIALFLSMLLKPYYAWMKNKVCPNPTVAMVLMFATIFIPIGLVVWYFGGLLISQVVNFITYAPELVERVSNWLQITMPQIKDFCLQIGVDHESMKFFNNPRAFTTELLSSASGTYGMTAVSYSMSVVGRIFGLLKWLLVLVFLCYFLASSTKFSGRDAVKQMPFLKQETKDFVSAQIDLFIGILIGFFRRQVVICLLEGLMYGSGFALVGLKYGFMIGFMLGVLNLIPFFGSIVCMSIAIPLAYFNGGGLLLTGVITVWLCGLLADGYLITPLIQGKRTGLGYAGVIFSFLFWGLVFRSFLGLLLAIPLSAFVIVFWRAVKEKYIKGVL